MLFETAKGGKEERSKEGWRGKKRKKRQVNEWH